MKVHVHSTLAKEIVRKIPVPFSNPYLAFKKIYKQTWTKRGNTWMPSLENWDGGLKSLLWLANSPHTHVHTCTLYSVGEDMLRDSAEVVEVQATVSHRLKGGLIHKALDTHSEGKSHSNVPVQFY